MGRLLLHGNHVRGNILNNDIDLHLQDQLEEIAAKLNSCVTSLSMQFVFQIFRISSIFVESPVPLFWTSCDVCDVCPGFKVGVDR